MEIVRLLEILDRVKGFEFGEVLSRRMVLLELCCGKFNVFLEWEEMEVE